MILSQRYPTVFNGIISGDPAMRTGLSNLAIGRWIPIAFNQIAPKDANGKPIIEQSITDNDRKLIRDALIKQCDAKDGIADGLISDPLGCDFDPEMLVCKGETNDILLSSGKSARHQEGSWRAEDVEWNPSLCWISLRHRHHERAAVPRIAFTRTRHFRACDDGHDNGR